MTLEARRRLYRKSSSFLVALVFSVLLGFSCGFLAFVIHSFRRAVDEPAVLASWTWQAPVFYSLSVVVISTMLLVIAVSFLISVFVVNRVNRVADTANNIIETGDLGQRINIESEWDDVSFLGAAINRLLDRLELLMAGVQSVSDNIAHDMRTPLTRLRNHLQDNQDKAIGPEERQKLLAEADDILSTFNTVMRISRLQLGDDAEMANVELAPLLEDVIEMYIPVAEERGIDLFLSGQASVYADRDLLFQLFANLVDNAVKFSPHGSDVTVGIDGQHVVIRDQGAGLLPVEIDRVTERFFRGDASRNTPGSGLGLAMVQAIVQRHQGRIEFSNADPGLSVRISLPHSSSIQGRSVTENSLQ